LPDSVKHTLQQYFFLVFIFEKDYNCAEYDLMEFYPLQMQTAAFIAVFSFSHLF